MRRIGDASKKSSDVTFWFVRRLGDASSRYPDFYALVREETERCVLGDSRCLCVGPRRNGNLVTKILQICGTVVDGHQSSNPRTL